MIWGLFEGQITQYINLNILLNTLIDTGKVVLIFNKATKDRAMKYNYPRTHLFFFTPNLNSQTIRSRCQMS